MKTTEKPQSTPQIQPSISQQKWETMCSEATKLFSQLRAAQARCPEKSIQRVETGKLAYAIDCWCRFVEENAENWRE